MSVHITPSAKLPIGMPRWGIAAANSNPPPPGSQRSRTVPLSQPGCRPDRTRGILAFRAKCDREIVAFGPVSPKAHHMCRSCHANRGGYRSTRYRLVFSDNLSDGTDIPIAPRPDSESVAGESEGVHSQTLGASPSLAPRHSRHRGEKIGDIVIQIRPGH
jgi:hypothetical protein